MQKMSWAVSAILFRPENQQVHRFWAQLLIVAQHHHRFELQQSRLTDRTAGIPAFDAMFWSMFANNFQAFSSHLEQLRLDMVKFFSTIWKAFSSTLFRSLGSFPQDLGTIFGFKDRSLGGWLLIFGACRHMSYSNRLQLWSYQTTATVLRPAVSKCEQSGPCSCGCFCHETMEMANEAQKREVLPRSKTLGFLGIAWDKPLPFSNVALCFYMPFSHRKNGQGPPEQWRLGML